MRKTKKVVHEGESIRQRLKTAQQELDKAIKEQDELDRLIKEAQQEDAIKLQEVENAINALSVENELFCGVILSRETIIEILKVAMTGVDNIRIPFRLYENSQQ